MSVPSKLKQSRAQWKRKASLRGDENRYRRKELRRVKQDRDTYKQRVEQAETQLKARQPQALPLAHRGKPDLVFLAV